MMSFKLPLSSVVTYNSRSPRSLFSALLRSLPETIRQSSPGQILLFSFAPSSTISPEILSDITSTLTHLCPEHVGCLSAPLPHQHFDSRMQGGLDACSLAYAFVDAVSFRSTTPGRAEAQVGRRHAARRRSENANGMIRDVHANMQIFNHFPEFDGNVLWEDVWNRAANSAKDCSSSPRRGNGLDTETLPDALQNLDPLAVDNIIYFTDMAPEGLANMLDDAFPQANKLSLIASSTPFITGRPITLFHNGSILSNGAVGIAFGSSPSSTPPVVELSFPPVVALSTDLNVTSSEGNLILSLDSGNPTRLLLTSIREHGLSSSRSTWVTREDDFYVGVMDPSTRQLSQLHRINAGDPSRGAIALEDASAPREGSIVRLYHLPKDAVLDSTIYTPETTPSISLFVASEMTPESFEDKSAEIRGDCSVVPNTFAAASENGFTLSRAGSQRHWKCVVPGAVVRIK